jgi:hypothetical protein
MSSARRSRRRRAQRATLIVGTHLDAVLAAGQAWQCPDCHSEHGRRWTDVDGVHHLDVHHDPECPWRAGVTR